MLHCTLSTEPRPRLCHYMGKEQLCSPQHQCVTDTAHGDGFWLWLVAPQSSPGQQWLWLSHSLSEGFFLAFSLPSHHQPVHFSVWRPVCLLHRRTSEDTVGGCIPAKKCQNAEPDYNNLLLKHFFCPFFPTHFLKTFPPSLSSLVCFPGFHTPLEGNPRQITFDRFQWDLVLV